MTLSRADLDGPWKDILRAYFPQAMQFFFPNTAALIDWERSEAVEKEFLQELQTFEEERKVTYVTNAERFGFERGVQEGEQTGALKGERSLILRQLTRRLGTISPDAESQVRTLSQTQLESLGEALLDFSESGDLVNWLKSHS
jgi:Domain of unknown function (DUF4351)